MKSKIFLDKQYFNQICDVLFDRLTSEEDLNLTLNAEDSQFIRFGQSKVRQGTCVSQGTLSMELHHQQKKLLVKLPYTGCFEQDQLNLVSGLKRIRRDISSLPEDPFMVPMKNNGESDSEMKGELLSPALTASSLLSGMEGLDCVGIYSGGPMAKANRNSKGQNHWFSTENFSVDFSLYTPDQKAVKQSYAGRHWSDDSYRQQLKQAAQQLELMKRPKKKVPKGHYRTYLAPEAFGEIFDTLSWLAMSYGAYKRGVGSLGPLIEKGEKLSPWLTIKEDFSLGFGPRFNQLGEVSANQVELIHQGEFKSLLVNSRSSKEYQVPFNGACLSEGPRSLSVSPGTLKQSEVLQKLKTGPYISNLHYLNFSDRAKGRITGMTRYACFWVEDGELMAPIEDLRFDDTLYNFLGKNLLELTDFVQMRPSLSTYSSRSMEGNCVPGALLESFTYTL